MFPRFHVNDAEKGGLRAPPRNKMALYELLSIPSQRFNSQTTSLLPLPLNQGGSLASSAPWLFGGGNQSNALTPFCGSEVTHLTRKPELHASAGDSLMENREINLMQSRGSSHFERVALRKRRNADDFTVAALAKRVLIPDGDCKHNKNLKLNPDLHMGDSSQSRSSREKQIDPTRFTSMKSKQCTRNPLLDNQEVSLASHERPVTLSREKTDASFPPLSKDKKSETSEGSHPSIIGECRSSLVDGLNGLACSKISMGEGCPVQQEISMVRGEVLEELSKGNASSMRSRLRSKPLIENEKNSANGPECDNNDHEDGEHPIRASEGNGCSVLDRSEESPSALFMLPDDVVGVIGEKQFWNARKAIVNQQRIFAGQVFELHRLIKVQKLLSRSPHLLESSLCFGKPLVELHAVKSVPSERLIEATTLLNSNSLSTQERNATSTVKLPLPSKNSDFSKKLGERPEQSHNSETSNQAACKPAPWCFPPIGNRWLVPVMSPPEGLIYKSYSAVCPPGGGAVGPLYGGCAPISFDSRGNDVSTTFGIPASHQQAMGILPRVPPVGQTFFLPWGIPLMNPPVASSAVEQMSNPFILGSQLNPQVNQWSTGNVNFSQPHQSSCNVSIQVSRVISCRGSKSQTVKENKLQGSTGSSPPDRLGGAALPLFPTDPTKSDHKAQVHCSNQQEKVIKVVPHNPRSAAESAARIFQSIQEERKETA
ncbi:ELF3-like protein 2 isoform X1 [Syzygium oleosum]|uniref:ELF3-like protein 2 isoform X1 n=2 Tax=Syzygium oleosum TaxID=219896 RepID=UPI0011D28615|nr:ELF3-like protein 2 isoform X1 [Syzygium oleosum]